MTHKPQDGHFINTGSRPLIINADELGGCKSFNQGILEAANSGFLSSSSIRVNGAAYEQALNEVIPTCPNLGIGVHLNIVEGKAHHKCIPRSSLLYHPDGTYRLTFFDLLRFSNNQKLLLEIENDLIASHMLAHDRPPNAQFLG